ncbi:MAG: cysteine peptidase family C39 domain-containing protein [Candidatus Altiarchaeota archaeon]
MRLRQLISLALVMTALLMLFILVSSVSTCVIYPDSYHQPCSILFGHMTSTTSNTTSTTTQSTTSSTSSTSTTTTTTSTSTTTTSSTTTSTTLFECSEGFELREVLGDDVCIPSDCFLNVPYMRQEQDNWCGPAVIQMVSGYYGVNRLQTNLATGMRTGEITTVDMLVKILEKQGFITDVYKEDDFEDWFIELNKRVCVKKTPVIVLQRIDYGDKDRGHYRVVVGMDALNVYALDPILGLRVFTWEEFQKLWEGNRETRYDNLLIVPHH